MNECIILFNSFALRALQFFFSVSTNGHYPYGLGNTCTGFFFDGATNQSNGPVWLKGLFDGISYDLGLSGGRGVFRVMVSFNMNSEKSFFGSTPKRAG